MSRTVTVETLKARLSIEVREQVNRMLIQIVTDDDKSFKDDFQLWCERMKICRNSVPRSSQWRNGKKERSIERRLSEWAETTVNVASGSTKNEENISIHESIKKC
eukprot:GHVN01072001.1.p3 GENE.GHVN01072001.1~~GHVN01072001.1.p3  ORF type:complete len:105 (-),score=8.72 GHVN01072001.1:1099-1413(-)